MLHFRKWHKEGLVYTFKINKHICNDISVIYFIALFMISEKFLNDASSLSDKSLQKLYYKLYFNPQILKY